MVCSFSSTLISFSARIGTVIDKIISHEFPRSTSYRVVILVRGEPDGCDCTNYVMRSMLRKGFCLTRLREIIGGL
jgi:hypothetical protein